MEIYEPFDETVELLTFNLKLLGKRRRRNVLISAGKKINKEKMLPAIKKLSQLNVRIFATEGTSRFFSEQSIDNQQIYKIAEKKEPNIKSFLQNDRFDLVVNILTGDDDYDEMSNSKIIRSLSIENGIPLITDVVVAIQTFNQLINKHEKGIYGYQIADKSEPWNLRKEFFQLVNDFGGFVCHHAHFDKAYLISQENLKLGMVDMQKKWDLYKYLKENYSHDDLIERISRAVEVMISQGVTYCRTFVDADSTVGLLPIKVALEIKEKYKEQINLQIGVQPLEGVLGKESRKQFVSACELADVVGGLPSKDRPQPEKHIDIILNIAKELGKRVNVHVDQENNPLENETELLAVKTIEHGMEGMVDGVHAISVAAKPEHEQDRIIKIIKDAGMGIIICPSAALSMKQLKIDAPLHNSIAPLVKFINAQVPVHIGVDNICDLFMPIVDGDMWFESRLLMEATRYYDIEKIARIACDRRGFTL